jgi:hypothetical protein
VSKRIGIEPRGLARIFGEGDGLADGQAANIAIPVPGSGAEGADGSATEEMALLEAAVTPVPSGGDVAVPAEVRPDVGAAGSEAARLAGRQADDPATSTAVGRASGAAILQAIPEAGRTPGAERGEFAEAVLAVYRTDADKPLTFRFARDENEWLETVCFEITRTTGVKMHKQDLVRLGLHLVLLDYRRRGDRSYALQLSRRLGRSDV